MYLKSTSIVCLMTLTCAMGVGCASKRSAATADVSEPAVLDISPAPAPAPVAFTPAPVAPPIVEAPMPSNQYTVLKGDTLWKIASTQYGDGKQWQKICSANPGLSPESLKAGQTIMLP